MSAASGVARSHARRRRSTAWAALAVIVGATTVAGCSSEDGDQVRRLGTVELYDGDADREQVSTGIHLDSEQLADLDAIVDDWSSSAAVELSDALAGVDPGDEFVVAVEYDRCGVEESQLTVDDGDVRFETTDAGWVCAHAEDVIDVYAVDWDATGDDFSVVIAHFGTIRDTFEVSGRSLTARAG